MKFSEIEKCVRGVPFISKHEGKYLYDLILGNDIRDILELGIAHGTGTCYMAAALQKLGRGHITSVDLLEMADHFKPSVEDQLGAYGLRDMVEVVRMKTGYTWFLHDAIRRQTKDDHCTPCYDLCIIDGPKNWTIDGAAFFMVDKLLRDGGWVIFDDYGWSYSWADGRRDSTDGITHRSLSDDEYKTPQIKEVFELLVRQHPRYSDFTVINDNWAIARKLPSDVKTTTHVKRHQESYANMQNWVFQKVKSVGRRVRGS